MKQRIITAILLMLVTIPCVIIGGYAFKLLCLIASLLGIYELLKICLLYTSPSPRDRG